MNNTPSSQSGSRLGPLLARLEQLTSPTTASTGGEEGSNGSDLDMADGSNENAPKRSAGSPPSTKSNFKGASSVKIDKTASFARNAGGEDLSMDFEEDSGQHEEEKDVEMSGTNSSEVPQSVSVKGSDSDEKSMEGRPSRHRKTKKYQV